MTKKSILLFAFLGACLFTDLVQAQSPQPTVANQPAQASWFSANKASGGLWIISDHGSDNIYLVEGNDKALLIDTGLGVARLSAFVKTLTAKPLIVVNTPGHPDHAGGDFEFKSVYAHPADFSSIQSFSKKRRGSGAPSSWARVRRLLTGSQRTKRQALRNPKCCRSRRVKFSISADGNSK